MAIYSQPDYTEGKFVKTITLPETDIDKFNADEIVFRLPVIAKDKKIVYIWKKSRNNKLVPGCEK